MEAIRRIKLNIDLKTIANMVMGKKPTVACMEKAIKEGETNKAITIAYMLSQRDLNETYTDGNTALTLAAQLGNKTVARALIKKGADVNAKNADGNTALHYATQNQGSWGIAFVQKLLSKGARVDVKNAEGKTAIDYSKNPNFGALKEILSCARWDQMKEQKIGEQKATIQFAKFPNQVATVGKGKI